MTERTEASPLAVSPSDDGDDVIELSQQTHGDDEVDVTLIRWMLSLTPLERLRTAQRYANSAQRLRNAPMRKKLEEIER